MKLRKTPLWLRDTYTYRFDNGDWSVVAVGKVTSFHNGTTTVSYDASITKEMISHLHKLDDKEVRENVKARNFEDKQMTKERIANKKQWDKEHPNEENPYDKPPKIIYLNSLMPDASLDMIDNFLYQNAEIEEDDSNYLALEKEVDEFVSTLSKKRQILYKDYYKNNLSQEEIAIKFGVSKNVIKQDIKRLKEKILKNF